MSLLMKSLRVVKAIYSIIRDNIKIAIKRKFCHHRYEWKLTASGRSTQTNEYIISDYDFVCTKCGKYLTVKMDREKQINGTRYVSCLLDKEGVE